jgi:hypothetical protein
MQADLESSPIADFLSMNENDLIVTGSTHEALSNVALYLLSFRRIKSYKS